jgi:hypothetical protein
MAIALILALCGLSVVIAAVVREHRTQHTAFLQEYWLAP